MYQERGIILVSAFIFLIIPFCTCIDTITLTRPLKDGDILVSNGGNFALGFFSPANSTNRYVGIWYNKIPEQTVVWVANRNRPITKSSGILLSFDETGNHVLHEQDQSFMFWSTNVSGVVNKVFSAKLLDSGNMVLFQGQIKEVYLWQSFDYPSNTYLPGMKIGVDRKTGLNRVFTSWKSSGNPGVGNYSHKMELVGSPQLFLFEGTTKVWRTGSWTGRGWSGVPELDTIKIFNATFINNNDEVVHIYQMLNSSIFSRIVVNESGSILASSGCDCLPGYERSLEDWYLGDGSKGCKRKVGTQMCEVGDGFVKLARLKVPDTSTARVNMSLGLKACRELCLRDCTCMGYASADFSKRAEGGGCITWHGVMNDTRTFSNGGPIFLFPG